MTKKNSTVNQEELHKFSSIADEWWDETGKFKPLHEINPVRLEYIIGQIKRNISKKEGITILDIGCGGGLVSIPLSKVGYDVTGLDASSENIKVAQSRNSKAKFICSSAEQLCEEGNKYDVVLALEVVEHVDNIDLFLNSCVKLLKKNGILIVSTINRTLKSLMFAKIGAEYVLGWLPKGTHQWDKFLTPTEVKSYVKTKVVDEAGMIYRPFSKKWEISDTDLSVNYFVTFRG